MAGDMPVICIQDGGMPGQRVVRTTVDRAVTDGSGVQPPAVIVIGAVAALGSPS